MVKDIPTPCACKCGYKAVVAKIRSGGWVVGCTSPKGCTAATPHRQYPTAEEAVNAWNKEAKK
jgi:hypothetical protein